MGELEKVPEPEPLQVASNKTTPAPLSEDSPADIAQRRFPASRRRLGLWRLFCSGLVLIVFSVAFLSRDHGPGTLIQPLVFLGFGDWRIFCELVLLATGLGCVTTSIVLLRPPVTEKSVKIGRNRQVVGLTRKNSEKVSSDNIFLTIAHYVVALVSGL